MPPQKLSPLYESVKTYFRDDDLFTSRGEDTIKYEHIYRRRESNTSGSEDTDSFIVGDRVRVGGTKCGVIAFIGETQFGPGDWAGVVLDEPVGKNDGTVSGIRYFQCPPHKGIFCRLSKLTRYQRELSTAHELLRLYGRPEMADRRRTSSNNSHGSSISPPQRSRTPITSRNNQVAQRNDLQAGDRVIVSSSQGSKVGVLRYIGYTEFGNGIWCGVELNDPLGKNDGSVSGVRYFDCAPKFGLFVPLEKVSRSPISRPKSQQCVIHPGGTTRKSTLETLTNTKPVRTKIYYPEWESEYY